MKLIIVLKYCSGTMLLIMCSKTWKKKKMKMRMVKINVYSESFNS